MCTKVDATEKLIHYYSLAGIVIVVSSLFRLPGDANPLIHLRDMLDVNL